MKLESDSITSLLRLPDGNIVIASWTPRIYVYDPINGKIVYSLDEESDTIALLMLKDNRFINVMSNCIFNIWEYFF